MKIISSKVHGILDYITVIVFAIAPAVLDLTGIPMALSYTLAIVHLLMTLLTDFSMGYFKLIPLKFHGWVEFAVGIIIPLTPFVLGFKGVSMYFYVFTGCLIFIVGLLSHYEENTVKTEC